MIAVHEGGDLPQVQVGDLVFCHSKGLIGWGIRLAQRLRSPSDAATWNHVATVVDVETKGGPWCIAAEGHGVTKRSLVDIAPGGKFTIVRQPFGVQTFLQTEFLEEVCGDKYGFLTIASCLLTLLTPEAIAFRRPNTYICSGLATIALTFAGWPEAHNIRDLYQTTPAELYTAVTKEHDPST